MVELTQRANARILRLRHLRDDAAALTASTGDRLSQLRRVLMNSPPDAAAIEFEIQRLQGALSDHQLHLNNLSQLLAQIVTWHQTLKFEVIDAKPVRVKLDGGIATTLVTVRQQVAQLDIELRAVRNAAPTLDEQKADCDAWIAAQVNRWKPKVKAHKHGEFSASFDNPNSHAGKIPIDAILAFMFPEQLRERLYAELENAPQPPLILSIEAKTARLETIRSEMLHAERQEAALLEMAEAEGQRLAVRPFISPLAMLNLALKPKESARAAA